MIARLYIVYNLGLGSIKKTFQWQPSDQIVCCIGCHYFWNKYLIFLSFPFLQRPKPAWFLEEENVFSFCWKTSGLGTLSESIASTEYRCPNGKRWRGILSIEGGQLHLLSLQLVSFVLFPSPKNQCWILDPQVFFLLQTTLIRGVGGFTAFKRNEIINELNVG